MYYLERFKPITYPRVKQGVYEIGDCGTVKNIKRQKELSYKIDRDGYITVCLYTDDGGRTTFRVHRLVAWEFCEGYDEDNGNVIVNHKDCDTSYPYYENLEWCTYSYNAIYSFEHGNKKGIRGEKSNFAKYTEKQIREVCELAEQGYSRKYISNKTNVNENYLTDILGSKKWTHITSEYNLPQPRIIKFKGFPDDVKNDIIELIKEGKTPKTICEILGIEYTQIHKNAITNLRKKI